MKNILTPDFSALVGDLCCVLLGLLIIYLLCVLQDPLEGFCAHVGNSALALVSDTLKSFYCVFRGMEGVR